MKYFLFSIFYFFTFLSKGQSNFFAKTDSLNTSRTISVTSGIVLSWSIGTIGMSNVWYSDYPKSTFHSFNDSKNWLQMDKIGHFYTANKISLFSSNSLIFNRL